MNRFDWTSAALPRWRMEGRDDEGTEQERDRLRFARRTLGSFGRGATWMPNLRGRSFKRAMGDLRDWWQMYLDQHPYRILSGTLAAGLLLGYMAARLTYSPQIEIEIEQTTAEPPV